MSPGDQDRTPTVEGLPAQDRVPHLVALTGPDVGTAYRLRVPATLVGREDGDLRVSQPAVSRRHALLRIVDDRVVVEDLGSTNGTFIGIERVKGPTAARDGDNIAFGIDSRFRLTYIPAAVQMSHPLDKQAPVKATPRFTREFLLGLLRVEHAYSRRHNSPLTLVFFRSDAVPNAAATSSSSDQDSADESLSRLATAIDIAIRTEDSLARSADDELAVIVRGDADAAMHMAERVLARIGTHVDLSARAMPWGTITAVVLPVVPAESGGGASPLPEPEEILGAAHAAAGSTMTAASNRVVRLTALVV